MKSSQKIIVVVVALVLIGVGGFYAYKATRPSTNLPAMNLTTLSPVNALTQEQLSSLATNFKAIGLPISVKAVTPSVTDGWNTPNGTPRMVDLGWFPDWPDPVAQQLMAVSDIQYGGLSGDLPWFDNSTLQKMYQTLEFNTNQTQQIQNVSQAYSIIYNQAPWIWLPNPDTYFFVQPYINNFTYNPYQAYYYNMMSYNTSTVNGLKAPTNNTLTDSAQLAAPDALDPATGFYTQDGPLFSAIYQQLVEFDGSNITKVVPVLANNTDTNITNITTNYQNYTFDLRHNVNFSNGLSFNATSVWFSLYRTILMGQGPGVANYIGYLFNATQYGNTGLALPFGIEHALQAANFGGYTIGSNSTKNAQVAASDLSNILSNFTYNATDMKVMEYKNQAVSVNSTNYNVSNLYKVNVNLLSPYKFFLTDLSAWWGAVVAPNYVDQHGGVQANAVNSYANTNGVPGTGPYYMKTIGSSMSTITLKNTSKYWGASAKAVPAVAEQAHIDNIVIDYTSSHSSRVSGFLDNSYQISYVSSSYIGQIAGASPFKGLPLNTSFKNFGAEPGVFYISLNTQVFPTNITDFRLALEYATNYSALMSPFIYNGTPLAVQSLGPISPVFKNYYNPGNLPMYKYNITKAIYYMNLAGKQGHFFVTLPNGTKIGDVGGSSGSSLFNMVPHLTFNVLALERNLETGVGKFSTFF
ncbi:MAG: ABC transporter substrate-binding protein [Thermoplasmataceae archaeon]